MRELTIPSAGLPQHNSAARYVFDNAANRPELISLRVRATCTTGAYTEITINRAYGIA